MLSAFLSFILFESKQWQSAAKRNQVDKVVVRGPGLAAQRQLKFQVYHTRQQLN